MIYGHYTLLSDERNGRWSYGGGGQAWEDEEQGCGRTDLQLLAQPDVARWSDVDSMGASALVHECGQYEDCLLRWVSPVATEISSTRAR